MNPTRVFFAWFYLILSLVLVFSFLQFIFYSYERSGLDNLPLTLPPKTDPVIM